MRMALGRTRPITNMNLWKARVGLGLDLGLDLNLRRCILYTLYTQANSPRTTQPGAFSSRAANSPITTGASPALERTPITASTL